VKIFDGVGGIQRRYISNKARILPLRKLVKQDNSICETAQRT